MVRPVATAAQVVHARGMWEIGPRAVQASRHPRVYDVPGLGCGAGTEANGDGAGPPGRKASPIFRNWARAVDGRASEEGSYPPTPLLLKLRAVGKGQDWARVGPGPSPPRGYPAARATSGPGHSLSQSLITTVPLQRTGGTAGPKEPSSGGHSRGLG
jgi:hypothetical protein